MRRASGHGALVTVRARDFESGGRRSRTSRTFGVRGDCFRRAERRDSRVRVWIVGATAGYSLEGLRSPDGVFAHAVVRDLSRKEGSCARPFAKGRELRPGLRSGYVYEGTFVGVTLCVYLITKSV